MLIRPKGLFRFSFNQNMGRNLTLRSRQSRLIEIWDFSTRQDKVLQVSRCFSTGETNFYAILVQIFKIETFSIETWLGRDFSKDLNWDFSTVETDFLKVSSFSQLLKQDCESRSRPRWDKSRPPSLAGIKFYHLILCS